VRSVEMKCLLFKRMRWFKHRPKTVYMVCPNCQRQDVSRPGGDEAARQEADAARQMVALRAVNSLDEVDALRRQKSTGDPLRDQALADIQAGFAQNVLDVARRLRRPGGSGDPQ
jgi:hypothetical protein